VYIEELYNKIVNLVLAVDFFLEAYLRVGLIQGWELSNHRLKLQLVTLGAYSNSHFFLISFIVILKTVT